jgi:hypothetical protein
LVDVDTISEVNILAEIAAGNFYASSGNDLLVSVAGRTITASSSGASDIEFIGFGGASLLTKTAITSVSYTAIGSEGYIRIKSTKNSDSTIAWSQPISVVSA